MSSPVVLIVDPYSSGMLLVQEFMQRGLECVIVQSTPNIPGLYHSSPSIADLPCIPYKATFEETLSELSAYSVKCVIPGCELGVRLADELSSALGLPGNDPQLKSARTDKFLMTERVRQHGLCAPAQFQASSLDELLAWSRARTPAAFILKPLSSTSSDGVFICESEVEICEAFDQIVRQKNALGRQNGAVLIQEFLDGIEYVVDTVSFDGQHRAAAFWRYGPPVPGVRLPGPKSIELLPYTGELQQELFAFTTQVLDALGIRYGAAHTELMWTNGAPALIELGARVNGGNNPLISRICTGRSQIQLLADAYLEHEQFLVDRDRNYVLAKHGIRVFLIPRCKGQYRNLGALDAIRALESFHQLYVGSRQSWDAPRRIGWVILVHADATVVERDVERVRELEEAELYTS